MEMRAIGIAAALGSAASWAVGSILFKRLGESLSPLAMTLTKGGVSVILLGVALFFTGYTDLEWQPLLLLVASGLVGIALGDTFFFEALQDIGAHTLVLLMMLGQVFTVLLAVVFLGETPTLNAWLGIALVVSGIGIVVSTKLTVERQASSWRGIAFGLLSVLCMSVSIIIAKMGLESISAIQATFIRMLSGTVGMFGFGIATRRLESWVMPFKDPRLVYLFLVSVCVVTFGGFWLSLVSIKYVDVTIANTLNSTEPIFILPLAAIFLREKVVMRAIVGTAIATAGVALLCAS
jgi:drug/metabolite transporter (DMT)-like permease